MSQSKNRSDTAESEQSSVLKDRLKQYKESYTAGDFVAALQLIQPLAEQGEARAQYNLAVQFELGKGVEQDLAQASEWYCKAAEQVLLG
jgi:TPR repeat protein